MKVAIAADGNLVTGHFGHCEHFVIFEVEEGSVVSKTSVANPGHRPGFLPNFLADQGVNVIVSGGMGGGAVDIFNTRNVEVIIGVSGDVDAVVNAYLANELQSTGSICHQHEHAHECGNH